MKKKASAVSRWALKRPFRFESRAALKDVVNILKQLEIELGFFTPSQHDITIVPVGEGYTFSYRAHQGRNHWLTVIPPGEGKFWQDANGSVVVEGTAQIYSTSIYFPILFSILFFIIPGVIPPSAWIVAIPFFALFVLWMIWRDYWHRNHTIDRIQEALMLAEKIPYYAKEKRPDIAETGKDPAHQVNEAIPANSVWNEAVSEYEHPTQDS